MKPFHLESSMKTMGGVFYPTGYMVLMFPTAEEAHEAALLVEDDGVDEDEVALATPTELIKIITNSIDDEDDELFPSAGTEGDTARRFVQLAREGHHALIVHAPSPKQSARLMEVLQGKRISYGQKYRHLVIEDLV